LGYEGYLEKIELEIMDLKGKMQKYGNI